MTTKIFSNYETLCRATADLIREFIHKKNASFICLASGHTPIGVFKNLIKDVQSGQLDISQCTFFSLDEWVGVDPNDPGSCLAMLKKDFFGPLNIPEAQINFFNVLVNDLEAECDRMNEVIEQHGGLDIMLVGVGTNGHIGMNEPGTSFWQYAHVSELAEETKTVGQKYFTKPTELSKGVTLGLCHLLEAKLPIVMASGEKKAAIIQEAFIHPQPAEEIPVTIFQMIEPGFVMLDEEAARLLEGGATKS